MTMGWLTGFGPNPDGEPDSGWREGAALDCSDDGVTWRNYIFLPHSVLVDLRDVLSEVFAEREREPEPEG